MKITAMNTANFVLSAKAKRVCNDYFRKEMWLRGGKKILKQLALILELPKDSYEIRVIKGGDAVGGDVILHGEYLYVCLSQNGMDQFMWRYCSGKKDYTGKNNNWSNWDVLLDLEKFAGRIKYIPENHI